MSQLGFDLPNLVVSIGTVFGGLADLDLERVFDFVVKNDIGRNARLSRVFVEFDYLNAFTLCRELCRLEVARAEVYSDIRFHFFAPINLYTTILPSNVIVTISSSSLM